MARRPASRSAPRSRRAGRGNRTEERARAFGAWWVLMVAVGLVAISAAAWVTNRSRPAQIEQAARRAMQAREWDEAARLWHRFNETRASDADSLLEEARSQLQRGHAREAEAALTKAVQAAPEKAEPWVMWLELLRLEARTIDAARVGRQAIERVPAESRAPVARAYTLALLADAPEEVAMATLQRWTEADPDDLDARLALMTREAEAGPRQAGPLSRRGPARAQLLESMLESHPEHAGVWAATVTAMAEAGEIDHGRALLGVWPEPLRDLEYEQLRGRWALDHDDKPEDAARAFQTVLQEMPHDWKTRTRLARALHAMGLDDEARKEADRVTRHREILDPARLGPRLVAGLDPTAPPEAVEDLARLCESLGLVRLAAVWREESRRRSLVRAG